MKIDRDNGTKIQEVKLEDGEEIFVSGPHGGSVLITACMIPGCGETTQVIVHAMRDDMDIEVDEEGLISRPGHTVLFSDGGTVKEVKNRDLMTEKQIENEDLKEA
jgi:hypothetical protein